MAAGRYEGTLVVSFLSDGRRVQLIQPFAYVDGANRRWETPKDAIVDGASIPRPLWTLIGGPFEGKYRDASVIHDWYCDLRNRPWKQVHRVFYEAMLTSGVEAAQAKLMYAGVYLGGPRWSETVVHNTGLGRPPGAVIGFGVINEARPPAATRRLTTYQMPTRDEDFTSLAERLAGKDLSLDEIDSLVDHSLSQRSRQVLSVEDQD